MRVLVDVDGVVADLMGGFERYLRARRGVELRPSEITTFHLASSPAHAELHKQIDMDKSLAEFLALPDVYRDYVTPIEDAVRGINRLQTAYTRGLTREPIEIGFVTATLRESPESYAPKYRWLDQHFPGTPVISCPSGQKHWFTADYGIDDRFDTCERWRKAGVRPLLFRQPWNEAPEGTPSYDWERIVLLVTGRGWD